MYACRQRMGDHVHLHNITMDAFVIIMGKPKPPPLLCMSAKSTRLESHAIKIYTHPPQPALGDHLQVAGRILE